MNTIKGECSVELIRENEDGSADFAFRFPKEALDALTRLGILTALKAAIEDAERLNPEFLEEDDERLNALYCSEFLKEDDDRQD